MNKIKNGMLVWSCCGVIWIIIRGNRLGLEIYEMGGIATMRALLNCRGRQ